MSRKTNLIVIALCLVIGATSQFASAVTVTAPGINGDGSGSGPYVRGSFTVGNYTTPAGLSLPQPGPASTAFKVGPTGTGAATMASEPDRTARRW